MMHHADRRASGANDAPDGTVAPIELPAEGLVLRGANGVCRVRCWPSQPRTAQLVLYQQSRLPTTADLARWCTELQARGFQAVRTSALGPAASLRVEAGGFHVVQELALLQHDDPRSVPAPQRRLAGTTFGRLLVPEDTDAATVDLAAFGPEWSLDAAALADVRRATPRHRGRAARDTDGRLVGFALTGRDSRLGFLQRLAVHPTAQRQGIALELVRDSLRWSARWRTHQVLVNTPTHNEPALALYERVGFRRLPDGLRVHERALP